MKKIRIITRHFSANYGSFLQAYATQELFKKYSDDVNIIDYFPLSEHPLRLTFLSAKNQKNFLMKSIYFILKYPIIFSTHIKYRRLQKKYLLLSRKYKKDINIDGDVFVVGSDQVWNTVLPNNELNLNYLLCFTDSENKITFSSSFGRTKISDKEQKIIVENLQKFKFISLRENNFQKLLLENGIDNYWIPDPVLFFDSKFWNCHICEKTHTKKYILVYKLHNSPIFDDFLKKYKERSCVDIILVTTDFFTKKYKDIKEDHTKTLVQNPFVFLSYIKNAEYICTDSYHGLLFSIIFKKNFSVINAGSSNVRIENILIKLNLLNKLINGENDIITSINYNINYSNIDQILNKWRFESHSLLDEAINEMMKEDGSL